MLSVASVSEFFSVCVSVCLSVCLFFSVKGKRHELSTPKSISVKGTYDWDEWEVCMSIQLHISGHCGFKWKLHVLQMLSSYDCNLERVAHAYFTCTFVYGFSDCIKVYSQLEYYYRVNSLIVYEHCWLLRSVASLVLGRPRIQRKWSSTWHTLLLLPSPHGCLCLGLDFPVAMYVYWPIVCIHIFYCHYNIRHFSATFSCFIRVMP